MCDAKTLFSFLESWPQNLNTFHFQHYTSKKINAVNIDVDPDYYHDYKVPYLPELEAQQSIHAKYPDIEMSTEEFKFVERLLPAKTIPGVKQHDSYPTPSGWIAPNSQYGAVYLLSA